MKRKIVAVVILILTIIFSMLSPSLALTLDEEKPDPVDDGGDVQPQATIDWDTLGRTKEAVVVTANQLIDLMGSSVNDTDVFSQDNDILVYAWDGAISTWKQIPFQVDERNSTTGSYCVNNSNGVLDGIDEIVFMSKDAGDRSSKNEWVVGCYAPRYEEDITDAETGDRAWA